MGPMSDEVSIHWGDHTWEEIRQLADTRALAVLPCGATEQHGPALLLRTDIRIAERVAWSAAEKVWRENGVRALVLPTLPYGVSAHHMGFAGTITLQPETFIALVSDVLRCVVKHGFRKIAVVSGHGGNIPALDVACHKVSDEFTHRPVRIVLDRMSEVPPWFAEIFAHAPKEEGIRGHADMIETSLMLADMPDRVRRDRIGRPHLRVDNPPEWAWMTHELTDTGALGDPTLASAELGEKVWQGAVHDFAERLLRLSKLELPD